MGIWFQKWFNFCSNSNVTVIRLIWCQICKYLLFSITFSVDVHRFLKKIYCASTFTLTCCVDLNSNGKIMDTSSKIQNKKIFSFIFIHSAKRLSLCQYITNIVQFSSKTYVINQIFISNWTTTTTKKWLKTNDK